MDLLHKKMHHTGDILYFMVSSVEEPYYYVRLRGEIMETTVMDSTISYRIKLLEILESSDIISTCIANKHFRVRSIKKKQHPYIDYRIRCDNNISNTQLANHIISKMTTHWFDVSMMLTFENETVMNDKLESINLYNIDKLSNRVSFLSKRNTITT